MESHAMGPIPLTPLWADSETLTAWTLDNLTSYWRSLLDRAARFVSLWSLSTFASYRAVWVVLGVSRLHYTLATGDISSKEDAGRYALQAFPDKWHRIVNESLRIRRADYARPDFSNVLAEVNDFLRVRREGGSLYATPLARRVMFWPPATWSSRTPAAGTVAALLERNCLLDPADVLKLAPL
jgi:hypothetical protein